MENGDQCQHIVLKKALPNDTLNRQLTASNLVLTKQIQ